MSLLDRNYRLEEGPYFIQASLEEGKDDLDDERSLSRMEELQSPAQRVAVIFTSMLNPMEKATHESQWIGKMVLTSFFGGMLYGGIFKAIDIRDKFLRVHNTHVYDNKYLAERAYKDGFVYGTIAKGMKYAVGASLFAGCSGFLIFGSMAYRNRLYLPDWLAGFTVIGAASRFMLGPRGMAVGGLFGLPVGLLCYGLARGVEIATGVTVPQRRLMNHKQYLAECEAKRRKCVLSGQREFIERTFDAASR